MRARARSAASDAAADTRVQRGERKRQRRVPRQRHRNEGGRARKGRSFSFCAPSGIPAFFQKHRRRSRCLFLRAIGHSGGAHFFKSIGGRSRRLYSPYHQGTARRFFSHFGMPAGGVCNQTAATPRRMRCRLPTHGLRQGERKEDGQTRKGRRRLSLDTFRLLCYNRENGSGFLCPAFEGAPL